ncbi:MAG: Ig-like domain-containing protein [Candidatus Moduliflexus flocculans]|nr:Ig-like domain-containing protein [Candidatus Moduliflexus flocculans]
MLVPVTGISLNKSVSTIGVGITDQLTATLTPSDATDNGVTWSSGTSGVASVSPSGLITGISGGTAIITATTVDGGKTATCTVSVRVPVSGVGLKANTSILVGFTEKLQPTLNPATATNRNVTWSTDTPAVATGERWDGDGRCDRQRGHHGDHR